MIRQSTTDQMRVKIEELLRESGQRSLSIEQLVQALGLKGQESKILVRELEQMQADGLILKTARGRYGLPRRLDCLTGVLQGNRRGFAFLRPDGGGEDVYISPRNLNDAVHGDKVVIRLASGMRHRRREGEVIEILHRGHSRLVGTLERYGKRYYVIPDDQRLCREIEVSVGKNLAKRGDKVVLELDDWSRGRKPPQGKVVERLGRAGTAQAEQLSLHRKYGLPVEFPTAVMEEAERFQEDTIDKGASEKERRDLRHLPMVTIDGETARDFDDAVSLETLEDGSLRLGVHIADVSYYVRAGKPLDREALNRATSTYLADQVIHMLPPRLSEDLCSLKAGRDRLALSVFMRLSAEGELAGYDFTPSVIRVTERLNYPQVEAILEGNKGERSLAHPYLGEMLKEMDRLAAELRRRRLDRGALDLDLPEASIILDDGGNPVDIERRLLGRAESLIEEFMILANETVAGYLFKNTIPCLYRIHTIPTAEKLAALKETLFLLGFEAGIRQKELKPADLKKLLARSSGKPAERLVRYLMLRSLPQARYSAENEGHFGLASPCYCHFTSPIRRYPDLVVHRILKESLAGNGLKEGRLARYKARLPAIAQQASERERTALEAERASEEQMKARYMEDKIGEVYPGIINGVAGFGIFVELENTVEGMIPIGELGDDYYVYQEKQAALVGERTRKTYRLGDCLTVEVVRVNVADGKITFALGHHRSRAKKTATPDIDMRSARLKKSKI